MNRYEDPADRFRHEGPGTVLVVLLATLAADLLAGALAVLTGLASYSKSSDHSFEAATRVMLLYLLAAVGLGLYWWFGERHTARVIGLALGLLPVFLFALVILIQGF